MSSVFDQNNINGASHDHSLDLDLENLIEDEIDLNKADSIMDDLFIKQINQLQEFQELINNFQSTLEQKDDEYCNKTMCENNEYSLWESMLESDITHYESQIQSYQMSLQDLKLNHETLEVKKSLEEQKTFVFETEVNKLRNKYDTLQNKLKQESLTHIEEYDVLISTSRNYGKQIIFSGNIFSLILSFIDIENIFKLERVSISWYDAIHSWKGWMIKDNVIESKDNNLAVINKYKDIVDNKLFNNSNRSRANSMNVISEASSSNYSADDDKLFYPRFRRFALSIETQKNHMYQVEIVGMIYIRNFCKKYII